MRSTGACNRTARDASTSVATPQASAKERLKRQWLIDHPEVDAETFERRAWPQLKKNLLEELAEVRIEQATAALWAGAGGVRYRL